MPEFVRMESEDGDPYVLSLLHEVPGIPERIEATDDMGVPRRGVPFHAEDGYSPLFVTCHIGDKDGMAVGPLPPGRIDENVPGLHILHAPGPRLLIDGRGVACSVDGFQVAFEVLPDEPRLVGIFLAVHSGEADLVETAFVPEVFRPYADGDVGALLAVTEGRPVDDPCGEKSIYTIAAAPSYKKCISVILN